MYFVINSFRKSSFLIGSDSQGAKAELLNCDVVDYETWSPESVTADVVISGSSYFNSISMMDPSHEIC